MVVNPKGQLKKKIQYSEKAEGPKVYVVQRFYQIIILHVLPMIHPVKNLNNLSSVNDQIIGTLLFNYRHFREWTIIYGIFAPHCHACPHVKGSSFVSVAAELIEGLSCYKWQKYSFNLFTLPILTLTGNDLCHATSSEIEEGHDLNQHLLYLEAPRK